MRARGENRSGRLLAQSFDVIQAQANAPLAVFFFDGAEPVRARDIDRIEVQAVALSVLDQGGRRVEAHGLIVQDRGGECGQVAALQICAGIGDQGEARGVRFGKTVERERSDGLNDGVLLLAGDAVARHARAQAGLDVAHACFGALESHGAAELFGFASGESGDDHRHAEQLLLK